MSKSRQARKALARRSYWNFVTQAETMAQAYKLSIDQDPLDEEENPNSLPAIACNSIRDIEELRCDWKQIKQEWEDIGFPITHNPFE